MPVQEGEYCGFETNIEDPGILVVTFNRPESLNASTAAMKRDLVELLTQTQMDDTIRIVVFTGRGQAFWAGDDLKGYGGDSVQMPKSTTDTTIHREPKTVCERYLRQSIQRSATWTRFRSLRSMASLYKQASL